LNLFTYDVDYLTSFVRRLMKQNRSWLISSSIFVILRSSGRLVPNFPKVWFMYIHWNIVLCGVVVTTMSDAQLKMLSSPETYSVMSDLPSSSWLWKWF